MAWNNQGGGPWGSGGGGGQGPWGRGPSGGGSPPPDLEELLRRGQDRFRHLMPRNFGGGRGLLVGLLVLLVLWGSTGFYRVQTDEQGVVVRFGRYLTTTGPGLHYHLPAPIEAVERPKVTVERQIEIGFRSDGRSRVPGVHDVPDESSMLTGDENIVDIDFTVIWDIKEAGSYLFNLSNPETTVGIAAESVMREVIGQTPIQAAMTEGRVIVEQHSLEMLQGLLDQYNSGIRVKRVQLSKVDPPAEVIDAFNDVQRAKADRERLRNEAEAYRNTVIPTARGESEKLVQEAQAYREEVVNRAQGDASRFLAVLDAYSTNRDVTELRLYYETMEELLRNSPSKVVIEPGGAQGVLPYLPLGELRGRPPQRTGGGASLNGVNGGAGLAVGPAGQQGAEASR